MISVLLLALGFALPFSCDDAVRRSVEPQFCPNETALPLLSAAISTGQGLSAPMQMLDLDSAYAGGMNLYGYQSSNPINHTDAMGLDWFEEEVDEAISDRVGHALFTLGMINSGAKVASLGLQTAIKVAQSLLPGSGLYDAFAAAKVIMSGRGGFWEAIDIATAAFPIAKKGIEALTGIRGLFKARGWLGKACNCFVAGTLIETPESRMPIQDICEGDEVLTKSEEAPFEKPVVGRVTRVFRNVAPVVLWLTLANGQEIGTTPGHEVWTVENGWGYRCRNCGFIGCTCEESYVLRREMTGGPDIFADRIQELFLSAPLARQFPWRQFPEYRPWFYSIRDEPLPDDRLDDIEAAVKSLAAEFDGDAPAAFDAVEAEVRQLDDLPNGQFSARVMVRGIPLTATGRKYENRRTLYAFTLA